jgi:hypothetical protein
VLCRIAISITLLCRRIPRPVHSNPIGAECPDADQTDGLRIGLRADQTPRLHSHTSTIVPYIHLHASGSTRLTVSHCAPERSETRTSTSVIRVDPHNRTSSARMSPCRLMEISRTWGNAPKRASTDISCVIRIRRSGVIYFWAAAIR